MTETDNDPPTHRELREETLAEYGEGAFPDTLVIDVTSDDPIGDLRELVDVAEAGERQPAKVTLDPDTLRQLLTPRRLELIESIMADPPASIQALADRLDRPYPSVHDDLDLLAEYAVIVFKRDGRANRPVIPYDRIEYSGVIAKNEAPA